MTLGLLLALFISHPSAAQTGARHSQESSVVSREAHVMNDLSALADQLEPGSNDLGARLEALDAMAQRPETAGQAADSLGDLLVRAQDLQRPENKALLNKVFGPSAEKVLATAERVSASGDSRVAAWRERRLHSSNAMKQAEAVLAELEQMRRGLNWDASPASMTDDFLGAPTVNANPAAVTLVSQLRQPSFEVPATLSADVNSAAPTVSNIRAPESGGWLDGLRKRAIAKVMSIALALSPVAPAVVAAAPAAPHSIVLSDARQLDQLIRVADSYTEADYVRANSIDQMVASYKGPGLYVVGDVSNATGHAPSESTLRRIAGFLQGKHWSVFFVATEKGMTFHGFNGYQAVKEGIGQGIMMKREFKDQKAFGQENGAVFYFILRTVDNQGQEKASPNFDYQGSAAQNARGLSHDDWRHNQQLSDPIFNALKPKWDWEKAVVDVITVFDSKLNAKMAAEQGSVANLIASATEKVAQLERTTASFKANHPEKADLAVKVDVKNLKADIERAQASLDAGNRADATSTAQRVIAQADSAIGAMSAYERQYATAKTAISAADAKLTELTGAAAAFRASHRNAGGDLAQPPLATFATELKAAQAALDTGDPAEAKRKADAVESRARELVGAMADLGNAAGQITTLGDKLSELKAKSVDSAKTDIDKAEAALARAKAQSGNGDSSYKASIQEARTALERAQSSVTAAEVAADEAAASSRNWKIFWGTIIALVVTALAGLGIAVSRRNRFKVRGVKDEAETQFNEWETALTDKLALMADKGSLFEATDAETLPRRLDRLMSSPVGDNVIGYTGKTGKLVEPIPATFKEMKELIEYLKNKYEPAREIMRPSTTGGKIKDIGYAVTESLTPAKYEEVLRYLSEDFKIDPKKDTNVLKVLKLVKSGSDRLTADIDSFRDVRLPLGDVMKEFNNRAILVVNALDGIEEALAAGKALIDGGTLSGDELAAFKRGLASDPVGTMEARGWSMPKRSGA